MSGTEELRSTLKVFTHEVCDAISQIEPTSFLWTKIVFEGKGTVSFPQEERRSFGPAFGFLRDLYANPPDSLRSVIDVVRRDKDLAAIMLVDPGGSSIERELTDLLGGAFLRTYFSHTKQQAFDETAFDYLFERLMTELHSFVIMVTELSPLVNARMDCERLEITPDLAIRKLTLDELEIWLNQSMGHPFPMISPVGQFNASLLACAIEVTYEKGKDEAWGSRVEITEQVSDLVTAIRLVTEKNVHLEFTQRRSTSILHPDGGTSSSMRLRLPGPNADLTSDLLPELIATWSHIRRLPSNNAMRLALRRWDIVAERMSGEDVLIDYWIALEALFAPESSQEVVYRLSLRIAAFVGELPEERERIYSDLRGSYGLRSRIVHGDVASAHRSDELVEKTRSYLRTALMKLLLSDEQFDPKSIEIQLLRQWRPGEQT